MAFKMVTDSEKTAGRIAGMAKAHAEEMTAEQVERWQGWLPADAEDVGIGQLQRFYAARLRRLCRAMTRAEKAHIRQLTAVKLLRHERDEAAAQVRHKALLVGKVLQGRHGEAFAEALLLGAAELTDPVTLARVAAHAANNLADPEREVPEPLVEGTELEFSKLASEIAEPAGRLSAHLDELEDQLPVLSATLERKIETLAAVKDLTRRLARFLEGLYGLEGHDKLQEKVKQALKKARKAVAAAERRESAEAMDVATEIADAVAAEAGPEHEDGRLRKAAQRLALRESPMAAFDEGEAEALAEAEEYYAQREAAAQESAAQEAAPPQDPTPAPTASAPGTGAGAGPPRRGGRAASAAAAAGQVGISRTDSGSETASVGPATDALPGREPSTGALGETGAASPGETASGREARRPRRPRTARRSGTGQAAGDSIEVPEKSAPHRED